MVTNVVKLINKFSFKEAGIIYKLPLRKQRRPQLSAKSRTKAVVQFKENVRKCVFVFSVAGDRCILSYVNVDVGHRFDRGHAGVVAVRKLLIFIRICGSTCAPTNEF